MDIAIRLSDGVSLTGTKHRFSVSREKMAAHAPPFSPSRSASDQGHAGVVAAMIWRKPSVLAESSAPGVFFVYVQP